MRQENDERYPLISVIVAIYNVEKYLSRCIESIINQTYQKLEIILIDDGSQDNSLEIALKYAKKDKRICVMAKENGGLSDARNWGLRIAKGEYYSFIDGDDYIAVHMLERLYNELYLSAADIAVCDFKKVYEGSEEKNRNVDVSTFSTQIYRSKDVIYKLILKYDITYSVAWNKLYRKNLFDGIEYPVGKIHEDEYITYKLLFKACKIVHIEEKMYFYLQRNGSIMRRPFSEERFCKIEAYKQRADFMINKNMFVAESVRIYLWAYYEYINRFKKFYPEKEIKLEKYRREYVKECIYYKHYLPPIEYLKLRVKNSCPKIYNCIKALER